jgi:hypothetical protein
MESAVTVNYGNLITALVSKYSDAVAGFVLIEADNTILDVLRVEKFHKIQ